MGGRGIVALPDHRRARALAPGFHRIAKALRIAYCYKDAQGVEIKEYLLIGYEGSGGI